MSAKNAGNRYFRLFAEAPAFCRLQHRRCSGRHGRSGFICLRNGVCRLFSPLLRFAPLLRPSGSAFRHIGKGSAPDGSYCLAMLSVRRLCRFYGGSLRRRQFTPSAAGNSALPCPLRRYCSAGKRRFGAPHSLSPAPGIFWRRLPPYRRRCLYGSHSAFPHLSECCRCCIYSL